MPRHALAIGCWVLAWVFSGFIPAAWFAARAGNARAVRIDLATGVLGAAGFTLTGVALW